MSRSLLARPLGLTAILLTALAISQPAQAVPDTQSISYGGMTLEVPSTWEVIDVDAAATACVRLDRDAVYLGTPPEQQDCPADAIGRGSTIWLGPMTEVERDLTGGAPWSSGQVSGELYRDSAGHEQTLILGDRGAAVRSAWGADETAVKAALATMAVSAEPLPLPQRRPQQESRARKAPSEEPMPTGPKEHQANVVPASYPVAAPGAASARSGLAGEAVPTARPLLGAMAFDTCSAPAVSTMQAWRQSPYVAVGIYTSGALRSCPFRGGSAWVDAVVAQGWGLIPIHVGLQSPCVQANLSTMSRDLATAKAQAVGEAGSAVAAVQALGMGPGTPIYLDLENYAMNDVGCSAATMAFVGAWTQELSRRGYLSAVYGGMGSLMRDMTNALNTGNPNFSPPDQIWMADWNQLQTTRDTYSPQYLPDGLWSGHQRMRQYAGGHPESWGGVGINIDSSWVDLALPGNPVRTDYGAATVGPGSAGFSFTGSMAYWRGAPGTGAQAKAYWTGPSSDSTEYNGATWAPALDPGIYRVEVNVPDTSNATLGKYTLTSASGTQSVILDQGAGSGYRAVGTVEVRQGLPATVHVADNGGGVTGRRIWADAARFVQVGFLPGAPANVVASARDSAAVISWDAADPRGSEIRSYTVKASPGGATSTVAGGSSSVQIGGLTNGVSYTFTVTATNQVGTGPSSTPSAAITPGPALGITAVTPTRVLDTRSGTPANPSLTSSIPAWGSLSFRVAGGSAPAPATAAAVVANLTVVAGANEGFLSVTDSGSSLINWRGGAIIANESTLTAGPDGLVRLTNMSGSPIDLVVDEQAYLAVGAQGRLTSVPITRLADTRQGTAANPRASALAPNETLEVAVRGSVVPAGAQSAILRLTATEPGTNGFFTASASGQSPSSVVNFSPGESVGNVMTIVLSSTGTVRITNNSALSTHLVVDVLGWVGVNGATLWSTVNQTRLLDTRSGTTANPGAMSLRPGEVRRVRVAGVVGSPVPLGARAIAVNTTVTGGTSNGWVGVAGAPSAAHPLVNYNPFENRAGFGWADVTPDGFVYVRNYSVGTVDVILDLQGHSS